MNNKIYFLLSVMIGYYFSVSALVDGDLDPTFGTGGIVRFGSLGAFTDLFARSIVVQQDGKIVVCLWDEFIANFFIIRLTTTGALDTTFNAGGPIPGAIRVAASTAIRPGSLVLDEQDNIIVAATGNPTSTLNVRRYIGTGAAAGTLDATFGTGGVLAVPIGSTIEQVVDYVIDSQGRILITLINASAVNVIYVVRVLSNGTLDATFGTGGIVTIPAIGGYQLAAAIKVMANDTIFVSGTSVIGGSRAIVIYQLSSTTGALVAPFNPLSLTFVTPPTSETTPLNSVILGKGLVIGSNGSLYIYGVPTADVVFGYSAIDGTYVSYLSYFGILNLTTAGALNTSFSNQGQLITGLAPAANLGPFGNIVTDLFLTYSVPFAGRMLQLADGKFIAIGYDANNVGYVVKLTPNGAFDTTFNGSSTPLPGVVPTRTTNTSDTPFYLDAAVQSNGYILAAGTVGRTFDYEFSDVYIARYVNTIGTPTPTPTPTIEEQLNQNSGALSCAIIQKYATAAVAATYSCNPMAPAPNSNCSK